MMVRTRVGLQGALLYTQHLPLWIRVVAVVDRALPYDRHFAQDIPWKYSSTIFIVGVRETTIP
jgi:hypothetical protein